METPLKQKLTDDLRKAQKDRDVCRLSVIRMALAAVHNAEIAKRACLEETDVLGIVAKEAKQRKESIEAFKQGNRSELAAREEAELIILQEYLPEQISRDDIVTAARQVIQETGACSLKDKGKVMGKLVPHLKGKAEGQLINAVVSELLS
ncbi:GatB/YqeY domain-containing protein [Chloroflexota bacterium]